VVERTWRITRLLSVGCIVFIILVTAGCAESGPPADAPSIRGTISQIDMTAGGTGSMLVEGQNESDTAYDRASVAITATTRFYDAEGRSASPDSLAPGLTVEVWFEGPVAESYPVQATAGAVKITR